MLRLGHKMSSTKCLFYIGFFVAALYYWSAPVDCIMCAVCRSSDHGCEGGHVASTVCPPEHDKCYTRHVYMQSVEGTLRGCTNQSFVTEGCMRIRLRGVDGVLCNSLCDWDACNSAFGLGPRRNRLLPALTSRRRR